ncbi:kinesin heavy chain 73 isoform X1 [Rhodnius prolixus]|uniref:kinesin heavy chain 73 isoform X1 n=1 Tax=Rhodnius prolixus TaxID=13249 RepID=UPI003D189257
MASDKIKVAVRVRPFNRRELELGTQCVVEMDKLQTVLHQPTTIDKLERKGPKSFAFDHCFNSVDPLSADYASQEHVFDCLGTDILDNAFQGYNACIFAYGQTGSGKSYTMMGGQESKGVIPRLCDSLFDRIAKCQSCEQSYKVEVSYMEIYNEKVHDLLDPKPNKQSLKVREHAVLGPYVDGLSLLAVSSFQDIDNLMAEGNKSRTVAATNMNCESSRSHAVFSVVLTQTLVDTGSGVSGERVSRMSLVDLAGSERAAKTGAVGDRLKEGSNINKSLTTLGLVISKLADQSTNTRSKQDKFVPYRDSVLTWLLKDNLGGNSKTVMVATISPAADNYEETLSTLRYADRAKRIVNHAVVNEDPNARIIRELRQEVEALKEMLKHATASNTPPLDIHEKLTESEKLMKEMSTTWEEKLIKTEQLQQERQEALENMGISVQASGIKVEKNKFYLVNLNADPSLNELLVYYLKERTLVGVRGASINQDIQLSGLGIQPEHCILTIEEEQKLYMTPLANARSFVNGSSVIEKTLLHNGDRILWGNHHFFRVNCPKLATSGTLTSSEPQTPAQTIDYNFAREEFMLNELSNDPLQAAIAKIERQHEEDKQVALEKQRKEYERQFQQLRNILSPSTPYSPYYPFDTFRTGKMTPCTPTTQMRVEKWAKERDDMFRRSLVKLKGDIVRANVLVQEANFLAEEMNKKTKFSVTLQIPPANLSPNRKKGRFVSEPAILVKRQGVGSQVWSMDKLENKIVDMREMYEERKENVQWITAEENPAKAFDPFYETQENHNLIGVANVFLEVLCHDVTLDYHTPIISQQGDVAGRLQVEITRISGILPQDRMCETASESSSDSSRDENEGAPSLVTIKVTIKQASGLPPSLSNFVFCQYTFWTHPESIAVPPKMNPDPTLLQKRTNNDSMTFTFDHTKEFTFAVTEEFIEHCAEGALSIEVWGHRSAGFTRTKPGWEVEQHQLAKARSLADRWSELTRKIELWVEIQELNEAGEYSGVEVTSRQDVLTGGVYQLRQGQQRRVKVRVAPVQQSGTLPIICEEITNIAVGSVSARSKLQKPLDSYQEEDLSLLREKWSEALMRRRNYLDQQIQRIINKQGKSERDVEREQSLVEQWVSLTEERNAVMVPASGSGIPGAPADWHPPSGMEPHIPVLFLDLNADDLSTSKWSGSENTAETIPVAGHNSILPKELGNLFYNLPIIKHCVKDVCAVAAWDSSVHDSPYLNRVTDSNERVYLILKTTVRLSHPAPMDLVLRKRLCLNIYKRQSITDRIRRRIVRSDWLTNTGVTYEVVSNIPKASEELEERESLAQIAASVEDSALTEGESYIETYTKGVSAVEGILTLERLRQKVAVKEILQHKGHTTLTMRKTASVPNFSHIMMFDNSLESLTLGGVSRSESVSDLNKEVRDQVKTPRKSLPDGDSLQAPAKQYGIGSILSARPTFLNLNLNLNTLRLQPGSKPSPNTKLGLRMTTLHEEQTNVLPHREDGEDMIEEEDEEEEEENLKNNETNSTTNSTIQFSEYESFQVEADRIKHQTKLMSSSRTLDSLVELQSTKGGTPSTSSSSGYGSQAVSSSNLTNDDCLSLTSISVDETPDVEHSSSIGELAVTTSVQHPTELPSRAKQALIARLQAPPPPSASSSLAGEGNLVSSSSSSTSTVSSTLQSSSVVNTIANITTTTVTSSTTTQQPVTQHSATQITTKATTVSSSSTTCNNVGKSNSKSSLSTRLDGHCSGESHKSSSDDVSTSNSGEHVNTGLPPGKVVRRRKSASRSSMQSRASFPQAKPQVSESKAAMRLEQKLSSDFAVNGDSQSSDNHTEDETEHVIKETPIPEWVCLGESVQIRPYNSTGVIAYIGPTEFASGTWVGVDLDAPYGKNDGTVQGVRYFEARPKHGIFVRADKLIQDRRGRAMRRDLCFF